MDKLLKMIQSGEQAVKAANILKAKELSAVQKEWLEKHLRKADFSERIRLNYYVGTAILQLFQHYFHRLPAL